MTRRNPDSRVRVIDGTITIVGPDGTAVEVTSDGKLKVTGTGGGGPGGTVDQGASGDPGDAWYVRDVAAEVALAAIATAVADLSGLADTVADADDLATMALAVRFARLQGYDEDGDNWDRLRVRFAGLEARDDYATFAPQRRVLAAAADEPFTLPADTRLIRVSNWSTTQRILVSPTAIAADTDDAAMVGVAPVTNLSNSEVYPVRLTEVHLWATGGAEATVEAFRGP